MCKGVAELERPRRQTTPAFQSIISVLISVMLAQTAIPAWTPQFQRFFDDAGLNIDNEINKIAVLGHRGPHPHAYQQYVFGQLQSSTQGIAPITPA